MNKPTIKELESKLKKARSLLQDSRSVIIIDREKRDENWKHLGRRCKADFSLTEDRLAIAQELLAEIEGKNYFWRGKPFYCNKPGFNNIELWEFRWTSEKIGCDLYVKFGFKKDKLLFLSFHPNEPERAKR